MFSNAFVLILVSIREKKSVHFGRYCSTFGVIIAIPFAAELTVSPRRFAHSCEAYYKLQFFPFLACNSEI